MPLDKSGSKEAIGTNIGELAATGKYPRKQQIAIALDVQRKAGASVAPKPDGRYRQSERKPKTAY